MRCEHCDYLLFNLTQPICPECGREFDIERYRFVPGEVSFHCPHCDQEYYGNDERGLPYPRRFTCVQCGRDVALQQMRVAPRIEGANGKPGIGSPWDNRDRLGLRQAWWQTLVMTLIRPGTFFRTHSGRSIREAWLFSMIALYLGFIPYFLYSFVFMWGVVSLVPAGGGGLGTSLGLPMLVMGIFYGVMALVIPLIGPFVGAAVWAALIQLALFLLAPARKPIGDTFRMAMYAFGPYVLYAVPLCGSSVGGVWVLVTLIFGVKEVHGIGGWRAAVAVLWPVVLLFSVYAGAFLFFILGAALA